MLCFPEKVSVATKQSLEEDFFLLCCFYELFKPDLLKIWQILFEV